MNLCKYHYNTYYIIIFIIYKFLWKKWGFTLIEILTVIAIISIISIWVSNINFNRLSEKQELDIFLNKIINNYEDIRNNSLLWKWIWNSLEVPEKWKIDFSNTWDWKIISYYYSWWLWDWIEYKDNKFEEYYKINKIECSKLDWEDTYYLSNETWTIEIEWSNITLTWACNDKKYKIFNLTMDYKGFQESFEINVLNWIVDKK